MQPETIPSARYERMSTRIYVRNACQYLRLCRMMPSPLRDLLSREAPAAPDSPSVVLAILQQWCDICSNGSARREVYQLKMDLTFLRELVQTGEYQAVESHRSKYGRSPLRFRLRVIAAALQSLIALVMTAEVIAVGWDVGFEDDEDPVFLQATIRHDEVKMTKYFSANTNSEPIVVSLLQTLEGTRNLKEGLFKSQCIAALTLHDSRK